MSKEPDTQLAYKVLLDRTRFDLEAAQTAADQWGFNCGPGALCAVLAKTPDELRPHLRDFESKGYTSPSMMADILRGVGATWRRVWEAKADCTRDALAMPIFPQFGLVRIQWDGSWCNAGVPVPARYRKSHWIAYASAGYTGSDEMAFDINAMCVGGWITFREWSLQLAPWLIRECVKGGNGKWWPTHSWEVSV
ncbi:MAG: hypothetical protein KF752_11935 [Pirellulaceae bacterium]|nr:hypothetical protein [Pirellulaceae bacterium]